MINIILMFNDHSSWLQKSDMHKNNLSCLIKLEFPQTKNWTFSALKTQVYDGFWTENRAVIVTIVH